MTEISTEERGLGKRIQDEQRAKRELPRNDTPSSCGVYAIIMTFAMLECEVFQHSGKP